MVYGSVIKILGNLLLVEAALMIPSLMVSIYYNGQDKMAFILSIIITSVVGLIMGKSFKYNKGIKAGRTYYSCFWMDFGFILVPYHLYFLEHSILGRCFLKQYQVLQLQGDHCR